MSDHGTRVSAGLAGFRLLVAAPAMIYQIGRCGTEILPVVLVATASEGDDAIGNWLSRHETLCGIDRGSLSDECRLKDRPPV